MSAMGIGMALIREWMVSKHVRKSMLIPLFCTSNKITKLCTSPKDGFLGLNWVSWSA